MNINWEGSDRAMGYEEPRVDIPEKKNRKYNPAPHS